MIDTLEARIAGRGESQPEQRELAAGLRFAESPRWRTDRLWFSDVHDYALKTVTLDGTVSTVARVPGRPAGLGFLPDGRLLMATAIEQALWFVEPDGKMSLAADLSRFALGPLNDMVVDGRGRAYVGDTGFHFAKGEKPRPGRVLLWQEGEAVRVAAEDVVFPNGCAITPDGRHMFLAETLARRITRFVIAGDGTLTDRASFAETDYPPDGLCLDEKGGPWAGFPEAGRFIHFNADGRADRAIAARFNFAVVPALGGPDRRTLFLCSADTDLKRLAKGDSNGRIDWVKVDDAGAGWP